MRCRRRGWRCRLLRRVERDRRQPLRRTALRAVIVATKVASIHREAMDHAGFAIGDEQRIRNVVEGEAAERRSRVRPAVERDIGEQADCAGCAVDPPDRSRPTSRRRRAPQAAHERRVRLADPNVHQRTGAGVAGAENLSCWASEAIVVARLSARLRGYADMVARISLPPDIALDATAIGTGPARRRGIVSGRGVARRGADTGFITGIGAARD